MPVIGDVRVTVARACPAGCDDGVIRWSEGDGLYSWTAPCSECGGTGVVWDVVTCAGCRYLRPFNETASWCGFWMSSTVGDIPCARWEAKE